MRNSSFLILLQVICIGCASAPKNSLIDNTQAETEDASTHEERESETEAEEKETDEKEGK